MKKLEDFFLETINIDEASSQIGFGSGCTVTEYACTYTTTGDGEDECVSSFDDDGNEISWDIQDEF